MALEYITVGLDGEEAAERINSNDQQNWDRSGQNANDITDLDTDKADKIVPASVGNLAALDASGNLTDSGASASSLVVRKGKTATLAIGTHTITFSSPMPDTNYINIVQGYLTTGEYAPPQVTNETVNGFDVTLTLPSIIRYSAGYE